MSISQNLPKSAFGEIETSSLSTGAAINQWARAARALHPRPGGKGALQCGQNYSRR